MRIEKIEKIRKKLKNNDYTIGTWQQIPSSYISEILAFSGYDWVAIDMEHGSISLSQLPDLFRALELGDTLPLVRVAKSQAKYCKEALDAGSGGIIAPMITNADQLLAIREACSWPPAGNRSVGFSRANLFGKNFMSYSKEAQSPLLIAQIEHIDAVNNLEKILKVDGLDGIMIGPYDLSASMGMNYNFENDEFKNVLKHIIKECHNNNIPCGDHVVMPNKKVLEEKISQGFSFLAYGIDAVFLNSSSKCPL